MIVEEKWTISEDECLSYLKDFSLKLDLPELITETDLFTTIYQEADREGKKVIWDILNTGFEKVLETVNTIIKEESKESRTDDFKKLQAYTTVLSSIISNHKEALHKSVFLFKTSLSGIKQLVEGEINIFSAEEHFTKRQKRSIELIGDTQTNSQLNEEERCLRDTGDSIVKILVKCFPLFKAYE